MGNQLLGKDLKLVDFLDDQGELSGKDLATKKTDLTDLVLITDVDNLVQALSLRLSNNRGILRQLGHPDYGSGLIKAIGTLNTESNRRVVENLAREVILQEPRVKNIQNLSIRTVRPGTIEIDASIITISEQVPLNMVFTIESDSP